MVRAIPGFSYSFEKVPIEVRANTDPFADMPEEEEKEATDPNRHKKSFWLWRFLKWLFFILFIILLIIAVIVFILYFLRSRSKDEDRARLMNTGPHSDHNGHYD